MRRAAQKVDKLGRFVIPVDIREKLGIIEGTEFTASTSGNKIILTLSENRCTFCGKTADIEVADGRCICTKCADKIKKGVEDND